MQEATAQENKDEKLKSLEDMVIESDTGARSPVNKLAAKILLLAAFSWSFFQLWIASPLPFYFAEIFRNIGLEFPVWNDTETRSIHLGFAIFLAFLAYPAFKNSPRMRIPVADWVFAIIGTFCAMYLYLFYAELSERSGIIASYSLQAFYYLQEQITGTKYEGPAIQGGFDLEAAILGMLFLLEATRRSLGPPLLVIASIFLLYTFFGDSEYLPEMIRYKGASLSKVANHQWLTTEGVFGIALGVSTSFVFLFVLFGALLDKAGAGSYFIKVAFSLLGHLRGGPAKAAVLSSGMTGLISGSSIANTVTTGTFTIPLMKRVGFTGEKAGAVEVSASVNGQIMPPVMGAAAFLMVEYVGISYVEVIKHAFLPAVISYVALLYMVHLEALKSGMQALPKNPSNKTAQQKLIGYGIIISSIFLVAGGAYYLLTFLKSALAGSPAMLMIIGALLFAAYAVAIYISCKVPELEPDDPDEPVVKLPEVRPTVLSGLHYILPIIVLVWCLMIERLSPGLSAFWATMFMLFVVITQKPIKMFFRKAQEAPRYLRGIGMGLDDAFEGMVAGARNMIGIGVATAAAGVIVGTVSLTGIGQVLTEVVETLAGGSLILILLFTALICIILGMGLPTTANYIVVSSLMAGVVLNLGEANGLVVPLIAVHMFVFYFGIMADVTPPVGLASFAAAAISGADPIRTGIQAFTYSLRTAMLPFFFIFNTELIMVGVDSELHMLWVAIYASVAILLLSASVQGYFIVRSKLWETLALGLVSVTLFVPILWINTLFPAFEAQDVKHMAQVIETLEPGAQIKISGEGDNFDGDHLIFDTFITVETASGGTKGDLDATLKGFGLVPSFTGKEGVYDVDFNTPAQSTGVEENFIITALEVPVEQPNKYLAYIPAIILLVIVVISQSGRRSRSRALMSDKQDDVYSFSI